MRSTARMYAWSSAAPAAQSAASEDTSAATAAAATSSRGCAARCHTASRRTEGLGGLDAGTQVGSRWAMAWPVLFLVTSTKLAAAPDRAARRSVADCTTIERRCSSAMTVQELSASRSISGEITARLSEMQAKLRCRFMRIARRMQAAARLVISTALKAIARDHAQWLQQKKRRGACAPRRQHRTSVFLLISRAAATARSAARSWPAPAWRCPPAAGSASASAWRSLPQSRRPGSANARPSGSRW